MKDVKPNRFNRVPTDVSHVVHLRSKAGTGVWQYWDYEQEKWSENFCSVGDAVGRATLGLLGDREFTLLVHTKPIPKDLQKGTSLWRPIEPSKTS